MHIDLKSESQLWREELLRVLRDAEGDLKHLLEYVDGRLVAQDRIYQTTLAEVQRIIRRLNEGDYPDCDCCWLD